ncbi:ABC transporter substrate-binding protein [Azotobacter vinelandii]|uniref:ABC transporter substrate-binding protein n=1 Tax=Azotobacter vinelandii TaxID=354 RepID=UPI000772D903|nr:ABC transporter substrate-binding protein [Azotobacter vinelandii]
MRKTLQCTLGAGALALALQAAPPARAADLEQYIPLPSFRVGPYASSGIPLFDGIIDYLTYVNETQGGINGVRLTWSECETGWLADKGVECYEQMKNGRNGSPTPFFFPLSGPIAAALAERTEQDRIPLVTIGYGITDATAGAVYPYNFPIMANFYSQSSSVVNYIAQLEGGPDKLRGKKIVTAYNDSPPGRETIASMKLLAEKYGFEDIQVPIPLPGNEQTAVWRGIRQHKPDYVFLRGWGVMTPVAIKTAVRFGLPAERLIGDIWSASEEDVIPAGPSAKGYKAITPNPSGTDFPVLQGIRKSVVDTGKSSLRDKNSFGSVFYNSGVMQGILMVEALRKTQEKYGVKALNGEEARWGFENLSLDEPRIAALGATGLLQPLKVTCDDHEGGGSVRVQQWDGQKWKVVSDWVVAERDLLRPLIDAGAARHAREKGIAPRDCGRPL